MRVYVEPNDGELVITGAIRSASKSIWLEIYILSDRNVIRALEEAANRGLDVRVMLEPHPFGGGSSASRTLDELKAAGVKARFSSPDFKLTHEKGIPIFPNVSVQLWRACAGRCFAGAVCITAYHFCYRILCLTLLLPFSPLRNRDTSI